MGPRHRKRTISTTEIMNEVERFSRRTISICAAPPPIISSNDVIEDDEEAAVESNPESKERDDALSISNMETIVHILKGNIGIGVLTLPMALRNSGLIFGSLGLIFIAYLCVYCMMLLVNAAHRVRNRTDYLYTYVHIVLLKVPTCLISPESVILQNFVPFLRLVKKGRTSDSLTTLTRLVLPFK